MSPPAVDPNALRSSSAAVGTVPADAADLHALVERIQADEGVHTQVEAPVSAWITDLGHAILDWLGDRTRGVLGHQLDDSTLVLAVATLAALLVCLVTLTLLRAVRAGRRRPRRPVPRSRPERPGSVPAPSTGDVDLVRTLLAAGRTRDALGAAWAWLAIGLDARGIGRWAADRTEREFVASVDPRWPGRTTLARVAGHVVVGVYGNRPPRPDEVEGVVAEARRLLAEAGGAPR